MRRRKKARKKVSAHWKRNAVIYPSHVVAERLEVKEIRSQFFKYALYLFGASELTLC
jgi:hypothetical protein